MTNFYESPEWKKGDKGQKQVARWLADGGWWIVPAYDYSGPEGDKAPRMFGPSKQLIIPDLDASRDGQRYWVEVKTKERATFHHKTRTWEHGFSNFHVKQYLKVAGETGSRVFIVFVETDGGRMVGHWLDVLVKHRRINKSWMGEMAFFPISIMVELGWLDAYAFPPGETPLLTPKRSAVSP